MKNHPLAQNDTNSSQKPLPLGSSSYDRERVIYSKFKTIGFENLTPIQKKSVPVISRRVNCLLVAPTGSGKTEAVIIPIFSMLNENDSASKEPRASIRALYITPLRALNNDVFRRIAKYAQLEGLTVEIRHGDTTTKSRRRILETPPDMLITTPESLAAILVNEKMLKLLKGLEWIVVDEVHELLPTERGAHLSISLERLEDISSQEITRIGLSATVGNLDEATKFLVGVDRKAATLVDASLREYDIQTKFVKGSINDVASYIIEYFKSKLVGGSVLLFTNTRDEAEYIGTILKNSGFVSTDVHHGSLSKEMREETEQRLRAGSTGIVVCTSSLELGLDIGSVDLVIHYGSPRQVSKLTQRIGRSRHTQRMSAKGLILTNIPDDELESVAIVRRMKKGSLEEQTIHYDALDVLAHHIVGIAIQTKDVVHIHTSFAIIKRAQPFCRTSFNDFQRCIDILDSNGIILYNPAEQSYKRRLKAYRYYFDNLSMIPNVLKFDVVDSISRRRIGTLDQQFVGDYGEKGNVFVLKGLQWRIISIDDSRMILNVEPLRSVAINIPYWVGEMIPVDHKTAEEVGLIRQQSLRNSVLSSDVISNTYTSLHLMPDARAIVVERSLARNAVVIHSVFGSKVNSSLASLLSTLLSSQLGHLVETRSDAYRIVLISTARIGEEHLKRAFKDNYDFEDVIIASLNGTHNINWRVWSVAKRFGMISKEAVYDRKAARLIYDRYSKTPIAKEAVREIIHDKYDFARTKEVLDRYKAGGIKMHWLEVNEFSELAKPILDHSGSRSSFTPLSIEKGVIELVKERLKKTKHRLICIRCSGWERVVQTQEAPEFIICPRCKSRLITTTFWSDYELSAIIARRLKGFTLSIQENRRFDRAWKAASLINNFGRKALIVLAGHGVGPDTAARILRDNIDDEGIYTSIYQAERQYVTTRGFWND